MIKEVNTDVVISNTGSSFYRKQGSITGFTNTEMGIMYIVTFKVAIAGITSSLFFDSEIRDGKHLQQGGAK